MCSAVEAAVWRCGASRCYRKCVKTTMRMPKADKFTIHSNQTNVLNCKILSSFDHSCQKCFYSTNLKVCPLKNLILNTLVPATSQKKPNRWLKKKKSN